MTVFYRYGQWYCQSLDSFGLITAIGATREQAIKAWEAMRRRAERE